MVPRSIAVAANFTAEALQPALAFWVGELSLGLEIRFAAYNQLFQEFLNPAGLLGTNHGFNVGLIRVEEWLSAGAEETARRLAEAIRPSAAPLLIAICAATPEHLAACAPAERILREALAAHPEVHFVEAEAVAETHDPYAGQLGHLPYTPLYFASLATAIARKIHALAQAPFKVIALDCDDTLWSGICGEDGPEGVVLDEPRRALQEFMAARRAEGMLLALCSKNNEEDASATFHAHPEFPLQWEDFAAARINWESKGRNLAQLAAELDLGLDSFILVDDNPKECSETQAQAPAVLALPLPSEAAEIPEFLRHVWAFDRARVTEEDRRRPELYAQRAQRAKAAQSAGSLDEFLQGLGLEIAIEPMRPAQVARVAQLTQRTNQMNAGGIRRTEDELRAMEDAECLAVSVKDRFGDYGLTGVMIFREIGGTLTADTFLLSCRALGRGVEHRMAARLGEIALERGLGRVAIQFHMTQRNRPARLFLESVGGPVLAAKDAAAIVYQPRAAEIVAPVEPVAAASGPAPKRPDYVKIAMRLRRPEDVLAAMQAKMQKPEAAAADAPRTNLERELAMLWAELLHVGAVGIHDNFFDMGGHSLLAVQLLSRVRQSHGADLSLEIVYSGNFTVAELAKAIELKEIEQAGGDYQELMAELEGLSDDEVRALLEQESDVT